MTGGREILKEISLFVLDMDGTFYLGDRRLDGALEFIHAVEAAGKKFLLSEGMLRRKNSISDGNKGAGGKF